MTSKTIAISEEAYKVLERMKRRNESLTDVIIRMGAGKCQISKLRDYLSSGEFEPISEKTAENISRSSKELRKNFRLRRLDI